MKTTAIYVLDCIDGNRCVNAEHGHQLGIDILSLWNTYDHIKLDFEGVNLVLSSFLYTVYERLLDEHSIHEIKDKLSFINMNEEENSEKNRIERMHWYISRHDEEIREIVSNIIEEKNI